MLYSVPTTTMLLWIVDSCTMIHLITETKDNNYMGMYLAYFIFPTQQAANKAMPPCMFQVLHAFYFLPGSPYFQIYLITTHGSRCCV